MNDIDPRVLRRSFLGGLVTGLRLVWPILSVLLGLIVGMGETKEEVLGTLADMRAIGIDIVTIGQYLRPTSRHRPIHRYVHPDEFAEYKSFGEGIGLPHVESGPLVRSSYHAKESRQAVPVSLSSAASRGR